MISTQLFPLNRVAAIAILAASVMWCPRTVRAEDDTTAAKAHYAMGLQHFNLAEYDQALAEFKEAYRNKPDPVLLFNIGQCHKKLGHTSDAITFYRNYLREAPDANNRKEVERRIEELEALNEAEAASTTTANTTKARPSPTSQAAEESAVAQTSGTPSQAAGVDLNTRNDLTPQPAVPIYKRWWFWTAAGAVAAGAATVAIVMARRDPTSVPGSTLGAQRAMP